MIIYQKIINFYPGDGRRGTVIIGTPGSRVDGQTDKRMDGRTNGWTDGRMDRQTDEQARMGRWTLFTGGRIRFY